MRRSSPLSIGEVARRLGWSLSHVQRRFRAEVAPGGKVQFPPAVCDSCPLPSRCTTSRQGRSVQIHPDERLLVELRARQQTPEGRAQLRERVGVEHALAHIGHWQGRRSQYRGQRKNLYDLRRTAVVHKLHVIARPPRTPRDYLTDVLVAARPALGRWADRWGRRRQGAGTVQKVKVEYADDPTELV